MHSSPGVLLHPFFERGEKCEEQKQRPGELACHHSRAAACQETVDESGHKQSDAIERMEADEPAYPWMFLSRR